MSDPLRRGLHVLYRALRNFTADHGANHAAAVAYFSLISLAPVVVLSGRLIARLLPHATGGQPVLEALAPFLPSEIAPSLGEVSAHLATNGAVLAVALPALFWVASHAFSSLEIAVNVAFGTTPQRRFVLSRLKAFVGLSVGVLVLTGTVVAGQIARWLAVYYTRIGAPEYFSPRAKFASAVALLVLTFGVFTLFYKLLPRGRVAWSAAARAAAVAVVLWEGARHVFGGILRSSPAFGLLDGALAGLVAVLGWVYVAVVVVLYGAEVAAVLNSNRS